jgi:hypothetical protein
LQLTPNFKKSKINEETYQGRKELKDTSENTGRKMSVELRLELACWGKGKLCRNETMPSVHGDQTR